MLLYCICDTFQLYVMLVKSKICEVQEQSYTCQVSLALAPKPLVISLTTTNWQKTIPWSNAISFPVSNEPKAKEENLSKPLMPLCCTVFGKMDPAEHQGLAI